MQVLKKLYFAVVCLCLSACGSTSSIKDEGGADSYNTDIAEIGISTSESFRVGMLLPLTGGDAKYGQGLKNASMIALNNINNPNLVLQYYDTQSTPAGARIAIENAINQRSDLIIGPLKSLEVQAVTNETIYRGVPVIAFSTAQEVLQPTIYTLGLLIAEGAFTKFNMNKRKNSHRKTVQISSSKEDMDFYRTVIPYPVKYIETKGYSWHIYIDDIDKKLDSLGLLGLDSHSKFIPDLYLYNSREVRLSLLKGLMDGDGCAVRNGASVFITTSERLSNDLKSLARSLGFKAFNNRGKEPSVMSIDGVRIYATVKAFRVTIASEEKIFMLPRKKDRQHIYRPYSRGSKASAILYKTAIVKAEYVGRKRCKCVTVDREDGLYLIGDYVVTHNCNLKGIFAYFSKMNCLYLLADTPEYLRDKDLVKIIGYGNKAKGYHATQPLNNYANTLIRNWFIQPVTLMKEIDGKDEEVTMMNLYRIKNRALLKEAMLYNPDGNFDRIRALGACMLLREEKMIQYQGNFRREDRKSDSYKGNDDFFKRNYDAKFFKFKDLYGMNK